MSEVETPIDIETIPSVERAAILLLTLGERQASEILKHLDPREVQKVGAAMAALDAVDTGQIVAVVDSFLEAVTGQSGITVGADDYIRRMLVGALGEDKAKKPSGPDPRRKHGRP